MHNILKTIYSYINENTEKATYQIIPFGILGFFTFPMFYFLASEHFPEQYESLFLRTLASLLCLPLILKNHWPSSLKKFLPIYWYFVILYTLPFFFIFMLFKNEFSQLWLMNAMQLIFFLILLVDWISFISLLLLGGIISFLVFYITGNIFLAPSDFIEELISLVAAITIGAIFSRSKSKLEAEKFEALKAFGATVAHELRTPLHSIQSGIEGIRAYLPSLISTYNVANDAHMATEHIRTDQLLSLESSVDNVAAESNLANMTIDMLLTNVRQAKLAASEITAFNASDLVAQALLRYPMQNEQRHLMQINPAHDFLIQGDKELLTHVLFNLLKNALYYIEAAQKGEIFVWFDENEKFNRIHFKDTGQGIASEDLPHVFDRFYTKTYHGSGIGLAFCKTAMQVHKGSITCQSKLGEYAEFIINFPKKLQEKI